MRTASRNRLAIVFLSAAAGIESGHRQGLVITSEDAALSAISPAKFTTIVVPLDNLWTESPGGGFAFRANRFALADGTAIRRDLTVFIPSEPPPLSTEAKMEVEGFLVRRERRFVLIAKSARFVSYRGTRGRWDPRGWNLALARNLERIGKASPAAGRGSALVRAVVLGHPGTLPPDVLDSYRRGGTYHLLVFSGMQIALAASLLTLLLRFAGLSRIADVNLVLFCFLAPLFVGDEPSVSRSSWMIGVFAVSRLLRRPTSFENLLFVSAAIRLLAHPEEIYDPGFALTYAATGGLLLIGKRLASLVAGRSMVLRALSYGICAEVATMPLSLVYFHRAVFASSIATVIVSPVLLVAVAAGGLACILIAVPDLALLLLELVERLGTLAVTINDFFADTLSLSVVSAAPPIPIVVLTSVGALLLLGSGVRYRRLLATATLLVPTILSFAVRSDVDVLTAEFLDVGQGDSILIRTGTTSMLIDGGGGSRRPEFGDRVLLPLLADRGIRTLDVVALSHPHPDHCGGLQSVLANFEVRQIWMSSRHVASDCGRDLVEAAGRQRVTIALVDRRGVPSQLPFSVDVIAPRFRYKRAVENNTSAVFRLRSRHGSILLTGDVEREAERIILEEAPAQLRSAILKVAHHGSISSTTRRFAAAVSPRIAVISCGRGNRFGHPDDEVVTRLRDIGTRIYRTDRDGTVSVELVEGKTFVRKQIDTPIHAP